MYYILLYVIWISRHIVNKLTDHSLLYHKYWSKKMTSHSVLGKYRFNCRFNLFMPGQSFDCENIIFHPKKNNWARTYRGHGIALLMLEICKTKYISKLFAFDRPLKYCSRKVICSHLCICPLCLSFFFLKFLADTCPFLGGHWYPCFGFLVMSPLGFKARVGSALFTIFAEANVMYIPQDSPLVLHLLTSWQPACSRSLPHMHVQRWDLAQIRTCNHTNRRRTRYHCASDPAVPLSFCLHWMGVGTIPKCSIAHDECCPGVHGFICFPEDQTQESLAPPAPNCYPFQTSIQVGLG